MKTTSKFSTTLLAILLFLTSFTIHAQEQNSSSGSDYEKDRVLIYVLKNILTRGHFVTKNLNDDFSELVYDSFINSLDPSKRYFTQEDLKEFSQYKYQIDKTEKFKQFEKSERKVLQKENVWRDSATDVISYAKVFKHIRK